MSSSSLLEISTCLDSMPLHLIHKESDQQYCTNQWTYQKTTQILLPRIKVWLRETKKNTHNCTALTSVCVALTSRNESVNFTMRSNTPAFMNMSTFIVFHLTTRELIQWQIQTGKTVVHIYSITLCFHTFFYRSQFFDQT